MRIGMVGELLETGITATLLINVGLSLEEILLESNG